FSNTILFDSNKQRDQYFRNTFESFSFIDMRFNFIRYRGTIRMSTPYHMISRFNYCKFTSVCEKDVTCYAYLLDYQYINDNTTEIYLLKNDIMTICQGDILSKLKNLSVTRKHLSRNEYNNRIVELKNNDDVIKTHTKRYTDTEKLLFDELSVLMQVSCSLSADFGKVDDPKIESSEGITFDKITSPVNLYTVKKDKFNDLMDKLSEFPWITQNIRSVSLVPSILLENKTVKVSPKSFNFDHLYTLRDNAT